MADPNRIDITKPVLLSLANPECQINEIVQPNADSDCRDRRRCHVQGRAAPPEISEICGNRHRTGDGKGDRHHERPENESADEENNGNEQRSLFEADANDPICKSLRCDCRSPKAYRQPVFFGMYSDDFTQAVRNFGIVCSNKRTETDMLTTLIDKARVAPAAKQHSPYLFGLVCG